MTGQVRQRPGPSEGVGKRDAAVTATIGFVGEWTGAAPEAGAWRC